MQQAVKEWLEEVVMELESVTERKCQFVSSVFIASCITEFKLHEHQLKPAFLNSLLTMLHIQPNLESKSCQNISYLLDITIDKFR